MTTEKFEKLVQEGIGAIPEEFLKKLDNVAVVIEDEPTPQQRKKLGLRQSHLLFGLYEGISQARRGVNYSGVLPDKITIFKRPIESYANSPEEIKEIVKNTVWHEIAHHFGLDEKQVRTAETKRAKNRPDI